MAESADQWSTRHRDLVRFLETKVGGNNDWQGRSVATLLSERVVSELDGCLHELSAHTKVRLLVALMHLNHWQLAQWSGPIERLLELCRNDPEDWVSTTAEMLQLYPAEKRLSAGGDDGLFAKTLADLRAAVREIASAEPDGLRLLPQSAGFMSKAAIAAHYATCAAAGHSRQGKAAAVCRHFTLKRKPRSAAVRAELLHKSASGQGKLKNPLLAAVVSSPNRRSKKFDDNEPLPSLPTNALKVSAGFSNEPKRNSMSSRNLTPRREGGAKLIEIDETPQALKRKRKQWEEEQRALRAKERQEQRAATELAKQQRAQERVAERQKRIDDKETAKRMRVDMLPGNGAFDHSAAGLPIIDGVEAAGPSHMADAAGVAGAASTPAYAVSAILAAAQSGSAQAPQTPAGALGSGARQTPHMGMQQQQPNVGGQLPQQPNSTAAYVQSVAQSRQAYMAALANAGSSAGGGSKASVSMVNLPQPPVNVGQQQQQMAHGLLSPTGYAGNPLLSPTVGVNPMLQHMQSMQQQQQQQQQAALAQQQQQQQAALSQQQQQLAAQLGGGAGEPQAPAAAVQPQPTRQISVSREVMQQAQDMFKTANKLSRPEKALIIGFMAGMRENPCPQMGSIITIRLSECRAMETQPSGASVPCLVETFFQMNYDTGEWKRLKKFRPLTDAELQQPVGVEMPAANA